LIGSLPPLPPKVERNTHTHTNIPTYTLSFIHTHARARARARTSSDIRVGGVFPLLQGYAVAFDCEERTKEGEFEGQLHTFNADYGLLLLLLLLLQYSQWVYNHLDASFIEQRRVLLQDYLSKLILIPQVVRCKPLLDFLGVSFASP
jgi:hypothetical protein